MKPKSLVLLSIRKKRAIAFGERFASSGSTKFDRPRNASVSKGARTSDTHGVRRKARARRGIVISKTLVRGSRAGPAEPRDNLKMTYNSQKDIKISFYT